MSPVTIEKHNICKAVAGLSGFESVIILFEVLANMLVKSEIKIACISYLI